MAKNNSKTHQAPTCPATRYAIGTSEFVGRCNPRATLVLKGCTEPKAKKKAKVEGKGLKKARKVLDGEHGFMFPQNKEEARSYHADRGSMSAKLVLKTKGVEAFKEALAREAALAKAGVTVGGTGDCTDNPFARLLK